MVIYEIVNSANGKKYIGKHIGDTPDNRWYGHKSGLNRNKHYNCHLQSAWNKYGEDIFEFNVIETGIETIDDLNLKEVFYIEKYNTMDDRFGYNLREGGSGGTPSEESIKKLSKSLLEGFKNGRITWNIGVPRTDKEKQKMSGTRIARWKEGKITPWNTGKPWSKKMKKKISESLTGRTLTNEHRDSVCDGMRKHFKVKEYIAISDTGEQIAVKNLSRFCREYSLRRDCMLDTFYRPQKQKQHKGWHLEVHNEEG